MTGPAGAPQVLVYPGPRNGERMEHYLRLDTRVSRDFRLRRGTFSLYLEIMNLLNRENLWRPEGFWVEVGPDGSLAVRYEREAFVSLIPSLGLRWTL